MERTEVTCPFTSFPLENAVICSRTMINLPFSAIDRSRLIEIVLFLNCAAFNEHENDVAHLRMYCRTWS